MAEFETVKSEVRDFGGAGFVSVERKRVKDGDKAASEFLLIARGFYLRDGTARRRNFVTVPDEPEVKQFIARALQDL
ncbi:MAG TPA: hypothetical protein VGR28_11405 [Candidatus Thermoplasmatota archaeon]|jgi:hypothetical protein|nr:hypothetical protein [Candidatus Thermoplasmatota archaeon]